MQRIVKAAAAVLLVALAGTAQAQSGTAPSKLQAWLGCWSGAPDDALLPAVAGPLVCITPTADPNVAQVATVVGGKVESTRSLDVTGRELPLESKGCSGVQSARWSADQRRIFLKSTATCGDVARTTTGILAMAPTGEWLDIQQVAAGGGENLRVIRYRDVGVPSSVPQEIADALGGMSTAVQGSRVAAGAAVGSAAVVEASHATPAPVVQAWVLERHQPFTLDAKELIALADAGVDARVTDAMIAVSNPQRFAVSHQQPMQRDTVLLTGRRVYLYLDRYDPWNWGYDRYGYYGYGSTLYGLYAPYGSAYGGYPYGYGYGSPVIVVTPATASEPHGRRVKGQGYQPPLGTTPSSTRAESPPLSTSRSGSASGSTASGSSSGSTPTASSSGRTAQPKP